MQKPHIQELCDWLGEHGATVTSVEHGGKHVRIYFDHADRSQFYVAGWTPSDWRAQANAIRDLRHMLGLVETERRIGERRQRRARTKKAERIEAPTITGGKDWRAGLYAHPLAKPTPAEINAAWLAFWRNCMASVGARSRL